MKKRALMLIMVIICYGLIVCNEDGKSHAGGKYSKEVNLAINALKERWSNIYTDYATSRIGTAGYLEIKNTRVNII